MFRDRRLQQWLVVLSSPADLKPRFSPPPIAATDTATLDHFLHLGGRHNIHLLVWKNLIALLKAEPGRFLAGSPDEVTATAGALCERLRTMRLQEVALTMMLAATGKQLMALLDGQPAHIVKGIDFATQAYHGLDNRKFSDIDLLIDPSAEASVASALATLGFTYVEPRARKVEQTERQWVKGGDTGQSQLVEVHTDLVHDPKLRARMSLTASLYGGAEHGGITNASRLVLAALHGATSHLFGRLQYVLDGLMIARAGVDPAELAERARACGATLPVATMLRLAADLYGCEKSRALYRSLGPVPGGFIERLLIGSGTVLTAKDEDRWRSLPQRHAYRRLLQR